MTREEAIAYGKEQLEVFGGEHAEFIKLAIEALEQESDEDAISRQAMLEYQHCLYGKMPNRENHKLWKFITELPSVTPTRKKGEWVKTGQSFINPNKFLCYSCSECGGGSGKVKTKFCPNCGAEMESEE